MGRISNFLGQVPDQTPYSKGKAAAEAGKAPPNKPTPDSDWASRLYYRGYQSVNRVKKRGNHE